jgi:hypothetical protein
VTAVGAVSLHEDVISLLPHDVTKYPLVRKELRRDARFVHFVHESLLSFTPVWRNHERNEYGEWLVVSNE